MSKQYIDKEEWVERLEEELSTCKNEKRKEYLIIWINAIKCQPTLDEKEIIRKSFERILERLEETEMKTEEKFHYLMDMREEHLLPCEYDKSDLSFERLQAFGEAIEIVKEECGI